MKMYRKIVRRQIRNLLLVLMLALPSLLQAADGMRSDSAMIAYLQSEGVALTQGNRVCLLKSGEEKFDDLFEAIRKARHYIHLEYFNFRNDSIAALLFAELDKKVQEGVKVRAMFDAFGNWSNNKPLKKRHLKELAERGIEIVKFDPLNFPFIGDFMSRDHRKIVIIDGQTAYTGGMNVADYYIEGLPAFGDWRDVHMRIEGPAVDQLQRIFLKMWEKATDERLTDSIYYFPSKTDSLHLPGTVDNVAIAIVDRVPRKTPKLMRKAYAQAILAAEEKIELINPYFIPTRTVRRALKKAVKNGVDVQVMVSAKGDIPITPDVSLHVARQLHKCGATVYQFEGGFHHSKVMMVDDKFCTVGSTNLNSRSLRYDYEVNAFIFDSVVTAELSDMFNDDKRQSTIMTDENWKQRSRWHRFVGWISNLLLTPFL